MMKNIMGWENKLILQSIYYNLGSFDENWKIEFTTMLSNEYLTLMINEVKYEMSKGYLRSRGIDLLSVLEPELQNRRDNKLNAILNV